MCLLQHYSCHFGRYEGENDWIEAMFSFGIKIQLVKETVKVCPASILCLDCSFARNWAGSIDIAYHPFDEQRCVLQASLRFLGQLTIVGATDESDMETSN